MKLYKVRSKKTGLYSIGSRFGVMSFSKNGKVYNNIGNVKAMLRQFEIDGSMISGSELDDLELVTFEVREEDKQNVRELIDWYMEG